MIPLLLLLGASPPPIEASVERLEVRGEPAPATRIAVTDFVVRFEYGTPDYGHPTTAIRHYPAEVYRDLAEGMYRELLGELARAGIQVHPGNQVAAALATAELEGPKAAEDDDWTAVTPEGFRMPALKGAPMRRDAERLDALGSELGVEATLSAYVNVAVCGRAVACIRSHDTETPAFSLALQSAQGERVVYRPVVRVAMKTGSPDRPLVFHAPVAPAPSIGLDQDGETGRYGAGVLALYRGLVMQGLEQLFPSP